MVIITSLTFIFTGTNRITGTLLYMSIRIYMLSLTFIIGKSLVIIAKILLNFYIDYIMYKISLNLKVNPFKSLIIMNLSWSILLLLQPFSNTLETICLLLCIYVALVMKVCNINLSCFNTVFTLYPRALSNMLYLVCV